MPRRGLRKELRLPEAGPYLLAYLELLLMHVRQVRTSRETEYPGLTLVDYYTAFYVVVFFIVSEEGSRQAEIVGGLGMPRRTVRDSLSRLAAAGVVERRPDGSHVPTEKALRRFSAGFDPFNPKVSLLCDTARTFRVACRAFNALPAIDDIHPKVDVSMRRRSREDTDGD